MKVLHLTLMRRWFDEIAAGTKIEEYREIKPYWEKKLHNRSYDVIVFRNGYATDAPTMTVEYRGLEKKVMTWDSGKTELVYALQLGKILEIKNYEGGKTYEVQRKKSSAYLSTH